MRSTFEQITEDLVERSRARCEQAMADAKVAAGRHRRGHPRRRRDPHAGGADPGAPADRRQGPEHDASTRTRSSRVGAAIQAGGPQGRDQDVLLLDVTPLSLGVETLGGVMTKIIERNTTIPARRTETFTTAEDNQPAVDIVVLQGERERAADNRVLGRFRLENIRPAPRGVPQIEVTFDIDANGILNVSARDQDTGAEQRITITESSTLDKAEVERMVAEAERHREEDARLREAIDARNELDSAAYQVERRVKELGDAVPAHEKARAEMLVGDARQAVKDEAPVASTALADL